MTTITNWFRPSATSLLLVIHPVAFYGCVLGWFEVEHALVTPSNINHHPFPWAFSDDGHAMLWKSMGVQNKRYPVFPDHFTDFDGKTQKELSFNHSPVKLPLFLGVRIPVVLIMFCINDMRVHGGETQTSPGFWVLIYLRMVLLVPSCLMSCPNSKSKAWPCCNPNFWFWVQICWVVHLSNGLGLILLDSKQARKSPDLPGAPFGSVFRLYGTKEIFQVFTGCRTWHLETSHNVHPLFVGRSKGSPGLP